MLPQSITKTEPNTRTSLVEGNMMEGRMIKIYLHLNVIKIQNLQTII
jgi:hypothetical protein